MTHEKAKGEWGGGRFELARGVPRVLSSVSVLEGEFPWQRDLDRNRDWD